MRTLHNDQFVIPVPHTRDLTPAGIQNLLKILDSPVSSTGQAHRRASLARNDTKVNYDTVSNCKFPLFFKEG
jgi:hypothetical protein